MTHEINLEAETHGDILMVDFVDSYNNLTLKSLHALKYFLSLKFSHMLKVDDDCFVNFNPLLRYTLRLEIDFKLTEVKNSNYPKQIWYQI